jgi:2-amino-4-hydroxy-6-hydroxymethyldihydropteridine diphosphokinase
MFKNKVFILLGTNLGQREINLSRAVMKISEFCMHDPEISSIYETVPWGFESDQLFLNQVIKIETTLNALEILERLLKIENQLGRKRDGKGYQSRTIDLDILYFNSDIIQYETLTIPHPRMHTRSFTMVPMAEIAAEFIHPVLQCSQQEILDKLVDKNQVKRYNSAEQRKD